MPVTLAYTSLTKGTCISIFQRKSYGARETAYNGTPSDACTVHFCLPQMSITRPLR